MHTSKNAMKRANGAFIQDRKQLNRSDRLWGMDVLDQAAIRGKVDNFLQSMDWKFIDITVQSMLL